jgi:CO/xanthine dehydrogenase Mo-binding subunit
MPRTDGRDKVTGATRYAADLSVPGTLVARIVPSVYAHARIRGIDATAALAKPGVHAVLTAADLPIVGRGEERRYEPLASGEAVFAGQPLALVVAETEAIAEDAVGSVIVDAEPLPAVVDPVAAMATDAPLVRVAPRLGADIETDADRGASDDGRLPGNVFSRDHYASGDPDAAFAGCAVVVEGTFRSPWAYQASLEPQAGTAWLESDGTLVVRSATQATFFTRNELASIFGLPSSSVRVIPTTLGGGFGAKTMVVEPLVAGAALVLRSPVRLVMTRQEDVASTNPAQGLTIELRLGAARDGRFEALRARMTYDAGAYTEHSWEWFAPSLITGPYRWPSFDIVANGVRTNRFGAGNYRAPTGPQGLFALESLVDELAGELGIDAVELRQSNLAQEGDLDVNGDPWPPTGTAACLDRLASHPRWVARHALPPDEGVGMAIGVWNGSNAPASAMCRVEPDGRLTVVTGAVDISGTSTAFVAIAAEAFGVSPDRVAVVTADTSSAPFAPRSAASAITYGVGPAVWAAAEEARRRVLALAADIFEIDLDDLEIVDGVVRPIGSPDLGRPVAEIVGTFDDFGSRHLPLEGHATTAHDRLAPSASGHVAHIRVDRETGQIDLLGYVVVQDAGRALNPALVEGQMLGGAVQSIGRALGEALVHDEHGQLLTGSFLDYAVPRAAMLPVIETQVIELPAPEGPYGAKGVGEASILAGPAAVANAVKAATGVRLEELPMTPGRVWAAMRTG